MDGVNDLKASAVQVGRDQISRLARRPKNVKNRCRQGDHTTEMTRASVRVGVDATQERKEVGRHKAHRKGEAGSLRHERSNIPLGSASSSALTQHATV